MFNNQYNYNLRNGARARVLGTCLGKNRYKTKNEVLKNLSFAGSCLGTELCGFFWNSGEFALRELSALRALRRKGWFSLFVLLRWLRCAERDPGGSHLCGSHVDFDREENVCCEHRVNN